MLGACGRTEEPQASPESQHLLAFVPADTPYLMANLQPLPEEVIDANFERLRPALEETRVNQSRAAREGRDPECRLLRDGAEVLLADWGRDILYKVEQIAAVIDRCEGDDCYVQAVHGLAALIDDPDETPSARLLSELQDGGNSFFEYAISMARSHRDYFASITDMSEQRHDEFLQEAEQSWSRQREIEAADAISFEEYLAHYYAAE